MTTERERKFLVRGSSWRRDATRSTLIRQGYLVITAQAEVRVRIKGRRGFLTLKGPRKGDERPEYEIDIPARDARRLLSCCQYSLIEKTRYRVPRDGLEWEIDVFSGANAGLVMAEVELAGRRRRLKIPPWIGVEVTQDERFYNAYLAQQPYATWRQRAGGEAGQET